MYMYKKRHVKADRKRCVRKKAKAKARLRARRARACK